MSIDLDEVKKEQLRNKKDKNEQVWLTEVVSVNYISVFKNYNRGG